MKYAGEGILDSSEHYFMRSTAFAVGTLYYVLSAGRFDVTPSYRVSRLNYDSLLLLVVHSGKIRCHSGDETATAAAGDLLLLDCSKPHTYYALSNASFSFIHFGGGESARLFTCIHEQEGLSLHPSHAAEIRSALDEIMAVSRQHKPLSETEISLAVYRILMTILSDARACRFPDDEKQIVSDSVEYILRHLSEKLSVEGIAAQYGYSAGYFSRLFRRSTGFSPYQFILNSRIDHSRRLLATTALPVQEIADRSGFAGLANFSCAFRRATGVSPSDFRKNPV